MCGIGMPIFVCIAAGLAACGLCVVFREQDAGAFVFSVAVGDARNDLGAGRRDANGKRIFDEIVRGL